MSKHTPGPWHFSPNASAFYSYWILCDAHEEVSDTVAEISNRRGEDEANARLIAAAPDMYEALKGMIEIAEMAMPDTYFKSDTRVNAARAALKKAEEG